MNSTNRLAIILNNTATLAPTKSKLQLLQANSYSQQLIQHKHRSPIQLQQLQAQPILPNTVATATKSVTPPLLHRYCHSAAYKLYCCHCCSSTLATNRRHPQHQAKLTAQHCTLIASIHNCPMQTLRIQLLQPLHHHGVIHHQVQRV